MKFMNKMWRLFNVMIFQFIKILWLKGSTMLTFLIRIWIKYHFNNISD